MGVVRCIHDFNHSDLFTISPRLVWRVAAGESEKVLGLAIVDPNERIRDFCSQTGLEFSLIRAELQELVDAAALD